MERFTWVLFPLFFILSACTIFGPQPPIGATESEVISRYGKPTARYQDEKGTLLEYYSTEGQYTWMVRMDEQNRFVSRTQVKTIEHFASIRIGKDNMQDVLHKVGQPSRIGKVARGNYLVWGYYYKEGGYTDSIMNIFFNADNIVVRTENGIDPRTLRY